LIIHPYPLLKILNKFKRTVNTAPDNIRGHHYIDNDSRKAFSRGAWAFRYVIEKALTSCQSRAITIFLPAYFCGEPLFVFRQYNISIFYYDVDDHLKPCWGTLNQSLKEFHGYGIFFLVHYFGKENDYETAFSFCAKYRLTLLEDCAHCLEPFNRPNPGYMIFSPWKLLGIPPLSFLLQPKLKCMYSESDNNYASFKAQDAKWLLSNLCYKIQTAIRWPFYTPPSSALSTYQAFEDVDASIKTPSRFALWLCEKELCRLKFIKQRRWDNHKMISNAIAELNGIRPLFAGWEDPKATPFAYAAKAVDFSKAMHERLVRAGVPLSTWPDLPPEIRSNRVKFPKAKLLSSQVLLFPIHQDISKKEMEKMCSTLKAVWRSF